MGVNESRHECAIAQIEDLGSAGMFHGRTNLDDTIPLNENFAWLDQLPLPDIEQLGGVENDRMRRGGRSLAARAQRKGQRTGQCQNRASVRHMARDGNTWKRLIPEGSDPSVITITRVGVKGHAKIWD